MANTSIESAVHDILRELPPGVTLVAAVKTRTAEEVMRAINAGVTAIGHNYVQEAENMLARIGDIVKWHCIGHLQKNKVKKAVAIFDMIETIDSLKIAVEVDKRCAAIGKVMPVLVEINSGRENTKTGVMPEEAGGLVRKIAPLQHVRILGLMTMGPLFGNPEDARPYFQETKRTFHMIREVCIPNVEMKFLSMGMTNSYRVAIEEGANIVRLGTRIFGSRQYENR
jgi:pyridoxal phosphate enzyme (YggS family)